MSRMSRSRIAGAVLLGVLGAGLLTRITDHRESPPKNPAHPSVEILGGVPILPKNQGRGGAASVVQIHEPPQQE